jgi:A/G-specific adenine glycosylase
MLQQTQVTTVIPYFEKFLGRFPTVNSLANASEDEVLHLWTGLGYYARARNLQKAARIITEQYNAELPNTQEALEALPGIGRSTAGAILAIAYRQQATILDGNVKRVLARFEGITGWPGQKPVADKLWVAAERLTPTDRIADYTQAIMDIGATLCRRSKPQCEACPFIVDCYAKQHNQISLLPGKKPKKAIPIKKTCMLIIENTQGEWLLKKRPSQGLWGGLWSFIECSDSEINECLADLNIPKSAMRTALDTFRHTFTHFHLDISPIVVKLNGGKFASLISESNSSLWFKAAAPQEIGLTRPVTKIMATLQKANQKTTGELE